MTKTYHCSNCNLSFEWQPETCPQCKGTSFYFTTEKGTQWDTAQMRMEEKAETVNTQQQDQKTFAGPKTANVVGTTIGNRPYRPIAEPYPANNSDVEVKTKRQEILEQAIQYTTKDRNSSYGEPEDNFKIIAKFWSIYLQNKESLASDISSTDVAIMMTLMKIARLTSNPLHEDSYTDGCGYLCCAAEVALKETK